MDIPVLLVTAVLLIALVIACLLPIYADSADDRGDGRTNVLIPPYVRTPNHRPRTWAFLAISAVLGLFFLGWKRPSLPLLYSEGVRDVAVALTHDPASVNGYIARLRPALAFFAVAYIVAISLVVRARPGRRLAMLSHTVLYLAMAVLTQALMITIGIATGWLVGPFGIEATLANLLIGGLVIMRLTFTAFALPRSTTVPLVHRNRRWDNVLTWCALITVITLLVGLYAFLSQQAYLGSVWQVFVPLYAVSMLFLLMFAPLWLIWWFNPTLPNPGPDRPPVDIIIPAYNEADNIVRLLRSIDIAARRYGGPVHVIVSNDGSVDETAELAAAEIATFRYADAKILSAENGGQAAALNRGIKITDSEIVVRVDADCVLGPDALVYAVPWFRDPEVGSVGAMEEPRTDTRTWFHEMRRLETLFQFRFARLGQSMVDGIVVIPGTFTAFRRGPAVTAGGFPVGMNGEDADLTMHIGRLGYRVVVDPRIRSYEDVPRSPGEFVEQRTRWARPASTSSPGTCRCGPAGWPPGLVLDLAPRLLLVLHPGRPGRPHLPAGTGADQPDLPAERGHVRVAVHRGRRDRPGRQHPLCGQVPVLARHLVLTVLVRLRVPAPPGHPGGGHLPAGPALPRAPAAGQARQPARTRAGPGRSQRRPHRGRPALTVGQIASRRPPAGHPGLTGWRSCLRRGRGGGPGSAPRWRPPRGGCPSASAGWCPGACSATRLSARSPSAWTWPCSPRSTAGCGGRCRWPSPWRTSWRPAWDTCSTGR